MLGIGGAVSLIMATMTIAFVVKPSTGNDQFQQNEASDCLNTFVNDGDWDYIISDPNYQFLEVDPKVVDCFDHHYENDFCKKINLTGPWKAHFTIESQNKAFKNGESKFYCMPAHSRKDEAKILRQEQITEIRLVGARKIGTSPLQDVTIYSDKSTRYVADIFKKKGNPPLEFHTPQNLLTGLRDQGECGSCVIFASTAAMETAFLRKNPDLNNSLDLAEQTFLNCVQEVDNEPFDGCNGTKLQTFFEHLIKHREGNLPLEIDDPYNAKQNVSNCPDTLKNFDSGVTVCDFVHQYSISEENLAALVAMHGAVVVGISVGEEESELRTKFFNYGGGIFDYCPDKNETKTKYMVTSRTDLINHALTIVGYGTHNGTKYWEMKNSWGDDWGEKGYFKMIREENCNQIGDTVMVPIVTKKGYAMTKADNGKPHPNDEL